MEGAPETTEDEASDERQVTIALRFLVPRLQNKRPLIYELFFCSLAIDFHAGHYFCKLINYIERNQQIEPFAEEWKRGGGVMRAICL